MDNFKKMQIAMVSIGKCAICKDTAKKMIRTYNNKTQCDECWDIDLNLMLKNPKNQKKERQYFIRQMISICGGSIKLTRDDYFKQLNLLQGNLCKKCNQIVPLTWKTNFNEFLDCLCDECFTKRFPKDEKGDN